MRKLFSLCAILTISLFAFAQTKQSSSSLKDLLKKAQSSWEKAEFNSAILFYERALRLDPMMDWHRFAAIGRGLVPVRRKSVPT